MEKSNVLEKYRILEKKFFGEENIKFYPQFFNETSIYSGKEDTKLDLRYENISNIWPSSDAYFLTLKEAQNQIDKYHASLIEPEIKIHEYSPKK